jgi:hypothetical protein
MIWTAEAMIDVDLVFNQADIGAYQTGRDGWST